MIDSIVASNALRQVVLSESGQSANISEINVSSLTDGIYFINIHTDEGHLFNKVIKFRYYADLEYYRGKYLTPIKSQKKPEQNAQAFPFLYLHKL